MADEQSFLEKVVAACGLSDVFAKTTIRRACERAGVKPEAFAPEDIERVVPHIRKSLKVFLPPEEVERSISRILMAAGDSPTVSRRTTRDSTTGLRKKSG
jgi:hypothetical protein